MQCLCQRLPVDWRLTWADLWSESPDIREGAELAEVRLWVDSRLSLRKPCHREDCEADRYSRDLVCHTWTFGLRAQLQLGCAKLTRVLRRICKRVWHRQADRTPGSHPGLQGRSHWLHQVQSWGACWPALQPCHWLCWSCLDRSQPYKLQAASSDNPQFLPRKTQPIRF